MAMVKTDLFQKIDSLELSFCLFFNRFCHKRAIASFFSVISRLGDGVFWYTLMLAMFVFDREQGLLAAAHMGVVALLGVVIYKLLKKKLVRQRPYISSERIKQGTAALDLYSFPSGHTLHAVCFTLVAISYYPTLAYVLIPFAGLVALSRVILGLHYPTDVLMGAFIGWSLAAISLMAVG